MKAVQHLVPNQSKGSLEVILGPVFSGKTSKLIKRIKTNYLASRRCIVVKYSSEQFEQCYFKETTIETHDGHSLPAVVVTSLKDIQTYLDDFDLIGIDDGHLFSDLFEFCQLQSENEKRIIVSGLDAYLENTIFSQMLNIIPIADKVTKMNAVCVSCCEDAPYSKVNNEEISDVGKYLPVCGECFNLPTIVVKRSPFKKHKLY